jgi:folate-binding protein YgfZ
MGNEYQQAREHAASFDLSNRGKVVVSGADARTFLHNLSTNDIKALRSGTGCESFFATAQARAVAYGVVFCEEAEGLESFWIDLDSGLADKVVRHLDRYIISEQVELSNRSAELAQWHVVGLEAKAALDRAALGGSCRIRPWNRLDLPGYDVVCPTANKDTVHEALLDAGATPASSEIYDVLRVEAGMPTYGIDIDDNRFVVEVGRKQAISYTKGCYLGQEPIVMARDRGHANRALLGLRVRSDAPLPRGTKLTRDGKQVGEVTSSVISPRFGTIALAYIRRGNQEPGTVVAYTIGGGAGAGEVVSLPFAV